MFSCFENGIKQQTPNNTIDLSSLVKRIKHNPQKNLIEKIRILRKSKDQSYKPLKEKLSFVTPSCILKARSLNKSNFKDNFISFSGYLYFDIDDDSNVQELKSRVISTYHDVISLVSISSSGGGILILVKITNQISSLSEYENIWEHIRSTIFDAEEIDKKSKGINHPMFISYDSEVFVNYENETYLDTSLIQVKKGISQSILYTINNNLLTDTLSVLQFEEVLKKIKTRTEVQTDKLNVDYQQVDFVEIRFPNKIRDNTKYNMYTGFIHILVYLNPGIDPNYLYSYLYYINERYANPKMRIEKLKSLFLFVYNSIIGNENYNFYRVRNKYIHFSKNSQLTGREKKVIASKLNGKIRQNASIEKILKAKEDLFCEGKIITQKSVAEKSGLSLITVKRYYNTEKTTDIPTMIEIYNSPTFKAKYNNIKEYDFLNRPIEEENVNISLQEN